MKTNHQFRKQFRLGEKLAEFGIKGVAFSSFAVIILIFVFVFREAAPIFSSPEPPAVTTGQAEVQETYGEPETGVEEVQETYGEVPASETAGKDGDKINAAEAPPMKSTGDNEGIASAENLLGKNWQDGQSLHEHLHTLLYEV